VDDIDRLALQAFINDTTRGGVRDAFVAGMEHARTRVSPQGEPVAWGVFAPNDGPVAVSTYRPVADLYAVEIDRHHPERGPFSVVPLYTTPRDVAPKVEEKYVPKVGDVVRWTSHLAGSEPLRIVTGWDGARHIKLWNLPLPGGPNGNSRYEEGEYEYVRAATTAELRAAGIDKADPAVAFLDAMARWHHDNKVEYAVVKDAARAYLASRGGVS
jgi:hypothetical protein